ncbi:Protein of unknown function [Reichenbachiella faecimaris]|uniref:DUF4199 domain-containing protein n=1 Tax=Reichenbachiella faecimaris TaxID=692418 RepID=A0A1W2GQ43_REIFA|nr:DUF4199 domain-containing protein [Reichenbachiella faecimaris]SMD38783.1 Protein of unknown function [Reichenbachiella faecimaris]
MKNIAIKYGLVGSVVMMLGVMLPFWIYGEDMELGAGEVYGYASMILSLTAIYFGIKQYKTELEGVLSFKQAFIFGTFVNFIAALAFGIFSYVLYAWLMPDFLQTYLDHSIAMVKTNNSLSAEEMEAELAYINNGKDLWLSPAFGGLLMFGTVFPIGLVMTLISSFALKTK